MAIPYTTSIPPSTRTYMRVGNGRRDAPNLGRPARVDHHAHAAAPRDGGGLEGHVVPVPDGHALVALCVVEFGVGVGGEAGEGGWWVPGGFSWGFGRWVMGAGWVVVLGLMRCWGWVMGDGWVVFVCCGRRRDVID